MSKPVTRICKICQTKEAYGIRLVCEDCRMLCTTCRERPRSANQPYCASCRRERLKAKQASAI